MRAGRWVAGVLATGAGVGLTATATATTFEGRCDATGTGHYGGVGLLPRAATWTAEANGVCTGRLDGRRVLAEPVEVGLRYADAAAGCASIDATASGSLRFPRSGGRSVRVAVRQQLPVFTARGAAGGHAVGYLTALLNLPEFQDDAVLQCLEGRADRYPLSVRLATVSPLRG